MAGPELQRRSPEPKSVSGMPLNARQDPVTLVDIVIDHPSPVVRKPQGPLPVFATGPRKEQIIGSTLYLTYTPTETPGLPSSTAPVAAPVLNSTRPDLVQPTPLRNSSSVALPTSVISNIAETSSLPFTSSVLDSIRTTSLATSSLVGTTTDTVLPTAQPIPSATDPTPGKDQEKAPEPSPSDDLSRITPQNVNRNAAIGIASGAFAGVAFLVMGSVLLFKMRKRKGPNTADGA
ncbi:hypothetical protein CDD82_4210 [Ophiocordyceps australis]|uniref:Uncharacterized protein n=1 Tax=Ophiocordyceps australis TaxID=1399860 RepID=A0A2C5Z4K6_9HYPO|nr:hypothetical protein CDD82_4210 [Ophiocordyceps australis]